VGVSYLAHPPDAGPAYTPRIPLESGARLGPYEILSALGAGGMGEVYRARDTKLNRDVAIKVLLPAVANDPDRLARFSREAQVLASLNHPNIAHIYGIEGAAIVMELVEGEDLAQRISRGPIPLDAALPIARQIAEALEAAHDHGIIHRDLKPANIKVRPDGTVKVLDFGLAKAIETGAGLRAPGSADLANSPTLSNHATQAGIILGTAAYMSPEQAAGKAVDRRSDLWAFGAVLLEMLTGQTAFKGETVSHVIAAVLKDEPHWATLPAATPDSVRRLLRRCLEKDRKRRCESASDARLEIDDAITPSSVSNSPKPSHNHRQPWAPAAAVVVAGLLIGAAGWLMPRGPDTAATGEVVRFAIPDSDRVVVSAQDGDMALSPDGRSLAFVGYGEGAPRIWVRRLDTIEARPLAGTEGSGYLSWSPDSRSLVFMTGGRANRIAVASGAPQVLTDTTRVGGASPIRDGQVSWGADGHILSAASRGVWRINANDGTVTNVLPTSDDTHTYAELLPGGRHMLVGIRPNDPTKAGTFAIAVDGGARTRIFPFLTRARYSMGRLLYIRDGVLYAHAFNVAQLLLQGEPVSLAEAEAFSVSAHGALAYVRQTTTIGTAVPTHLSWMDRAGRLIGSLDKAMGATRPTLSPDGRRLVMLLRGDVWVLELERGVLSRVTSGGAPAGNPIWAPGGQAVLFQRAAIRNGKDGIFHALVGSAGKETLVLGVDGTYDHGHPTDVSSDGRHLTYESGVEAADVWVMPLTGERTPRPFAEGPGIERQGTFSPDGRWISYSSDSSGRFEIYVQSFPEAGARIQVSPDGGSNARWRRDGREMFYMAGDGTLMAMPVSSDPQGAIQFGRPTPLFRFFAPNKGNPAGKQPYDVAADGQRFIVSAVVRQADPVLHVLLNWPAIVAGGQKP
jgi:Tol biopolymer transport system component